MMALPASSLRTQTQFTNLLLCGGLSWVGGGLEAIRQGKRGGEGGGGGGGGGGGRICRDLHGGD